MVVSEDFSMAGIGVPGCIRLRFEGIPMAGDGLETARICFRLRQYCSADMLLLAALRVANMHDGTSDSVYSHGQLNHVAISTSSPLISSVNLSL